MAPLSPNWSKNNRKDKCLFCEKHAHFFAFKIITNLTVERKFFDLQQHLEKV